MILTCHLLAGAVVASKISNPFLAMPLALLSHYLLDAPPQKEYLIENIRKQRWNNSFSDFLKVWGDISLGIMLISLFSDNNLIIFAGAFLAITPDGITLLSKIFSENKLLAWHQKFHISVNSICDSEKKKIPAIWGILTQAITVLAAIYILQ